MTEITPTGITEKLVLAATLSDDLDQIYELNLRSKGITKIENLTKCVKLRSLDLSCNSIKKIENLQTCEDLKELKLFHNSISVVEGLSKNGQLQTLLLQSNKIEKLEEATFKALSKLTTLRLDYNNILKLEGLSACRNLTYLDLTNNKLSRVEGLDTLVNLEDLYLSENNFGNIENLSRNVKLRELRFSKNRISSGSGLPKTLTQLTILRLDHNILPNLASFTPSKSLNELFIQNNELSTLLIPKADVGKKNTIADLFPYLEILDASNNKITDLEGVFALHSLSELVELVLTGNPICSSPNYPNCVWAKLTQLQLLDGIPRDPNMDYANAPVVIEPPQRPPSASKSRLSTTRSPSPSPPSSSRPTSSPTSPSSPTPTPLLSRPTSSIRRPPSAQSAPITSRPATPYSARPPSALSSRPQSARPQSALMRVNSNNNNEEGGTITAAMPLMAPASSMSKVQRMPSLMEIEQQFDKFKDQLSNFSSSAIQRAEYIRSVLDHPNTLGKQFANSTTPYSPRDSLTTSESESTAPSAPAEAVSPWMAPVTQSPRPKTPKLALPLSSEGKRNKGAPPNMQDMDSDSYADDDLEVRAAMDGDSDELTREDGEKRSESKVRRERSASDASPKSSSKTKPRSNSTSSSSSSATSSSTSNRARDGEGDSKPKRSSSSDAKRSSKSHSSSSPSTSSNTYVPSDILSFVNSVLNRESSDEEDFDIPSTYPQSPTPIRSPKSPKPTSSSQPKSESRSKSSSSKTRPPTPPKSKTKIQKTKSDPSEHEQSIKRGKALAESTTPTAISPRTSSPPLSSPSSFSSLSSASSSSIPEKFYKQMPKSASYSPPSSPSPTSSPPFSPPDSSREPDANSHAVPKLSIPKSKSANGSDSSRSNRVSGPVGPVFDEEEFYDDENEYL